MKRVEPGVRLGVLWVSDELRFDRSRYRVRVVIKGVRVRDDAWSWMDWLPFDVLWALTAAIAGMGLHWLFVRMMGNRCKVGLVELLPGAGEKLLRVEPVRGANTAIQRAQQLAAQVCKSGVGSLAC